MRIARDLHDEIGSIALISQDILANSDDPAQTRGDLSEINTFTITLPVHD